MKTAMLKGLPLPKDTAPRNGLTLDEVVEEVWRIRWRDTKGEETARINIKSALEYFGPKQPVADITQSALAGYVDELAISGLSNATINRKLSPLNVVLNHAMSAGALDRVPKLARKVEPRGRIRFLTAEEEVAILDLFDNWGNRPMKVFIKLSLDLGTRVSETLRLTWQDVDMERRLVHIWNTKSNRPRAIPMTNRVHELLVKRLKKGVGSPCPQTLTPDSIRYQWDRMKAVLGLSGDQQFIPHSMRHTFASRLIQRGAHLAEVQELMGHADITTTRRYAHLTPANLEQAIKLLDSEVPDEKPRKGYKFYIGDGGPEHVE
jgi:integrase